MSARPARERFAALAADASREERTEALYHALAELYLAPDADRFQQSGRSSGAAGWEPKRRVIAEAVHRDGHLLDVGCANGLLLESLIGWCAEQGHRIEPHGVDMIWELVALARARHPRHAENFEVANAFWWSPPRRYDFVRTNLEYHRPQDRAEALRRLRSDAVAPGGRLIVCHYPGDETPIDCAEFLSGLGWPVAGAGAAGNVRVAWSDVPG